MYGHQGLILFLSSFGGVGFDIPLYLLSWSGVSVIGRYSGLQDDKTSNKKKKDMIGVKSQRTGEIGVFA